MTGIVFFNKFKENLIDASTTTAFGSATIKLGLVTVSYVPSGSHEFWSTPVTNEVSGGSYTAGGATTTATVSGGTTVTTKVVLSSVTWSRDATGFANARYAIIYKATGTNSTSELIGYVDFGANKSNINGDFTIAFDATAGAFSLT